jgi:hypothetical protein
MPPPKKIKLPSGALPADIAASHRAYAMDRAKRIRTLLADVAKNERLETQFFANPNTVAKKFGVTFNPDEIAGLKSLRGVPSWRRQVGGHRIPLPREGRRSRVLR